MEERIVYYVDNDPEKNHAQTKLNGKVIEIISPQEMLQEISAEDIILIGSFRFKEIIDQLDTMSELNDIQVYVVKLFMEDLSETTYKGGIVYSPTRQIPKKIHYCWFGGKEMGELEKHCLATWKKFCPDYEIIRWDETNYDYTQNQYISDAYKSGKYAFVSDYARLDVIYRYGGIYLDTDVEILRSIDQLLYQRGFMGFESNSMVNSGVGMGGVAGIELFATLRDAYQNYVFIDSNGKINDVANCNLQSAILKEKGLRLDNTLQEIDGIRFYPSEFLSPVSYLTNKKHITENTYSVHWFTGSWQTEVGTTYRNQQLQYMDEIIERLKRESM